MRILLITSGGDAPGMNRYIWEMYKRYRDNIYFAFAGFTGLINGQIFKLKDVVRWKLRNVAGCVTKSSRCPEFKVAKFFNKGYENAKDFDVVVILGGNGSEKGARRLFEKGINTIFVPGTIDNDVKNSHYSIGFSTAVNEGVYAVEHSMMSIDSFNHACLFEVMGRDEGAICREVAKKVGADYAIADEEDLDFEKIKNIILKNYIRTRSSSIIIRENLMDIREVADKLNEMLKMEIVKTQIVGRTQRGGVPTREELRMVKKFARETKKCISKKKYGVKILVDKDMNTFVEDMK